MAAARWAGIITAIRMDDAALYRLMTWLSPAYPVGAFSYSHGIEWLVEEGQVHDKDSLAAWIADILAQGGGRNDAILLAHAWRAARDGDDAALAHVAELALAFTGSAERHLETTAQGMAFCDVTRRTWSSATLDRLSASFADPICYPVAVGAAAADHGIALDAALFAYLQAFAANLVSAGVRLVPLGHSDGQRVTLALEAAVRAAAQDGAARPLSALAGMAIMADIAAMKHETQYTRLFRS